jgi:hypothetical protein
MKRSENYLGTVNNDVAGWAIIKQLKERGNKIRLRGRHPNRRQFFNDNPELGHKYCEPWFVPARKDWEGIWRRSYIAYAANKNDINPRHCELMREKCPELKIAIYFR